MPPIGKFRKSDILQGAVSLIKRKGYKAFNVRALAMVMGTSTTPILQAFGRVSDLVPEITASLEEEMRTCILPENRPQFAWELFLCHAVVFAWKEPLAYQALEYWKEKKGWGPKWEDYLALFKEDPRTKDWSEEKKAQRAFHALVYSRGFASFAAHNELYQPSEYGIITDFIGAISNLVFGGLHEQ